MTVTPTKKCWSRKVVFSEITPQPNLISMPIIIFFYCTKQSNSIINSAKSTLHSTWTLRREFSKKFVCASFGWWLFFDWSSFFRENILFSAGKKRIQWFRIFLLNIIPREKGNKYPRNTKNKYWFEIHHVMIIISTFIN